MIEERGPERWSEQVGSQVGDAGSESETPRALTGLARLPGRSTLSPAAPHDPRADRVSAQHCVVGSLPSPVPVPFRCAGRAVLYRDQARARNFPTIEFQQHVRHMLLHSDFCPD